MTPLHRRPMPRFATPLTAVSLLLGAALAGTGTLHAQDAGDAHMELALRVLRTTPLIDGHNDLPWAIRGNEDAPMSVPAYDLASRAPGQTDIERLRAGGVGGQFWSVYVPADAVAEGAARFQLEEIDIALQIIERYPEHFALATTAADVERIFHEGRIASLLGMEGGHAIENSLGALRAFYALGVRYMTLTHSANIDWADAGTDDELHGGLTEFGREVVREMNRMGMLVDLSHTSINTMHHALDVAEAPVIFSHSSARALTDHVRNVPDDVLRRLPENGGVVMVTFVPSFINEANRTWDGPGAQRPRATIGDVADHIEHVRAVAGIDHVGIGSDFDGITSTPVGLEDVSTYPALLAELSRRGWTESELRKLVGVNVLRAMRDAESTARRLQRERDPSTRTIEELDGLVS
jgi:membrane dipeptidase